MRIIRLKKDILLLTLLISIGSVAITNPATGQGAALPDVLNLAPADAPVVVVVPSLSGLSQKIAKLNQDALGGSVPHMFDVLSMFKAMTGITAGLDDNGSLMLVMTRADMANKPPMVMLVPVMDYAAFIGNFGGNAADPVATLTLPHTTGFAKQIDQYAILGDSKEDVENFQPGNAIDAIAAKVGTAGKRCLTTGDLLVIFDIAALKPVLEPGLQEMRNGFDEVSKQATQVPQGSVPGAELVPLMMTLYMNAIDALVRDTSTAVMGLDISSQGVSLAKSAQFKPDSHLATIFTTGGGAAQQLNRLPNQPYWMASGLDLRGIATATLAQDLIAAFEGQNEKTTEQDPLKMTQLIQQAADMIKQTTGIASVYYQPAQPVMMGGNFLNGVAVYETTDGPAYIKAIQEYFQAQNDFFGQIANLTQQAADNGHPEGPTEKHATHDPQQQMSISTNYTPNALQVNGNAVDEYEIKYTFPPEMMQDMGPAGPMMMMMMGGAGQSGYVTTKGKFVVMTTTRDPQVLQQALEALDQNAGLGTDAAIKQVRQAGVLPNSSVEFYMSIPGVMSSVNMFMGMWGMQPIQVPADLPPIASSLNVEDHGIAAKLHVPTKVIAFCYSAAGQAMMGGGMRRQGDPQNQQPQDQPRDPFAPPPAPF